MDPRDICSLVEGRLDAWHGLQHLERERLPPCLGPRTDESTVRFRFELLSADTHHPASGGIARVYWAPNGGTVELVEVELPTAEEVVHWTAPLGAPDAKHVYSNEERAVAHLESTVIEESIWAARGLAVAIGRDSSGTIRVARIRGYTPATVERYLDELVRFDPEPL